MFMDTVRASMGLAKKGDKSVILSVHIPEELRKDITGVEDLGSLLNQGLELVRKKQQQKGFKPK